MKRLEETLRQLRQLIGSERYPLDSRLPAERDLAEELGVSRTTLRKVLAILEAEGLIRRHVGQGTFVGSRPNATDNPLSLSFQPCSPAEIIQARQMLEPQIVALCARQANLRDIEHLRYFVDKSEKARDFEAYERWDTSFHRALAEASHNAVCMTLMEFVNELRKYAAWGDASRVALTLESQRIYARQHRLVVDAIAERSPSKAAERMRQHLKTVERFLWS